MSDPARDDDLARRDALARREAQRCFDRPFALEAGAGTGKTTVLVARVLAWSLGPGWEKARREREDAEDDRIAARVLARVVAITFTEAAAAEMSRRMGHALLEVERGLCPEGLDAEVPKSPGAPERARALRAALDHLFVDTIHAWCRRLLASHPLEGALHPRLEVDAEERVQLEVVREVLEEGLREAYGGPEDGPAFALSDAGISPRRLEEELVELLRDGMPARELLADPFAPERVEALAGRLRAAFETASAAEGDRFSSCGAPLAEATARALARCAERLRDDPPRGVDALDAFVRWLREQWPKNRRDRLRSWSLGDFPSQSEKDALGGDPGPLTAAAGDALRALDHAADIDVPVLAAGRRLLQPLLAEVEARLRARGAISFSGLLAEARTLLHGREEVAARVREGIDQLLVDEFQDTDGRQCDVLRAVALSGPADARPGLFLVGDPKQSIYGWRSADLAAYEAFLSDVDAAGGRREQLSVNYRSAPAILDEVERVVAPVMHEEAGVQPAFEALVPCPELAGEAGFENGRSAAVEYWAPMRWDAAEGRPVPTRAQEAVGLEAAALARDLRALHDDSGVAWSACGILFRSRGDWETYLSALRRAGVPYAVEGDRSYYQRREVIDAAALVRWVLDPNDHLALVAALRSAAIGVPDAALIPLWVRDFPARVGALQRPDPARQGALRTLVEEAARAVPDDVPGIERLGGWERNLLHALDALAVLRRSAAQDPPDVFVERLRTLFLLEVSESARNLGAWRVANLDRFFRELSLELSEGDRNTALRRLRGAVVEEREAEEGRPVEILEDAVRVMTIHGAKGLDFEHVYLMQLHKGAARTALDGVHSGEVEGRAEYRLLGVPTPAWDACSRDRERVEQAERVRTLYVAMTRARRRFVLAGLWSEHQLRAGAGRAMDLIEGREHPAFQGAMAGLAASGGDRLDFAQARWVFPALSPEPERRAPSAAGPPLASLESIAAASRGLLADRESARARADRPFLLSASAEAHAEQAEARAEPHRRAAAPSDGEVARSVGTAVHRALEALDFASDPDAALAAASAGASRTLASLLSGAELERARRRADEIFGKFAAGALFGRLRALAGRVVARELPVLLPAAGDEAAAVVTGAVDLVYRDPQGDQLVVVDYKTDGRHRPEYARQGAVYQRALRDALGLPYTPRFELWYLVLDRIETA